ncbi:NO-inducible flavohemoprotein [Psychromonas sp. Urea-02u-13]|uniref:NO-inducible flavohemoprotein n=1 Tax=Psychromonas sp. Urea-02u-13 TaxID=2058326 RepID=UPI000C321174|nr:NO-inducible flavohemoprotein [Psychromonas sp. Urea-02u-13]PKG40660.1 NO-inducible flavohemoprotein [Psychromonas sp. Urea-02u-13]
MLNDTHIQIIKSTVPLLENAGSALTDYFYKRMFTQNPELQHIFNMSNQHTGRQQVALFEAIAAYAKNIDNLAALTTAVERIAQKHTSFSIQAPHYAIVGEHLLGSLRELLPEQFTAEVEEAWTLAYQFLAQIFIDREAALYQEKLQATGGWTGTRAFKVIETRMESDLVKTFIFEPVDKKAVIDFIPGQYLGLEVFPTGRDYKEIRQYSLSDKANGQTYRISVKRETLNVAGIVSNFLHDNVYVGDEINLLAPAGDFFFKDEQKPVVLLSAGVGITPMQSMMEQLSAQKYQQPVHYLHACENKQQHSFQTRVSELATQNDWLHTTWYRESAQPQANIKQGFMDLTKQSLPIEHGHFYLCGPVAFMQFAKQQLLSLGVAVDRVFYEVFGPHANL